MPSGYEKSPDYGGPPHDWKGWLLAIALFLAAGAVYVPLVR